MGRLRDMLDGKTPTVIADKRKTDRPLTEPPEFTEAFPSTGTGAAFIALEILKKARGNKSEIDYLVDQLPIERRKPVRRCIRLYQQRKQYCLAFRGGKFWR